jgi:hypothetical protein
MLDSESLIRLHCILIVCEHKTSLRKDSMAEFKLSKCTAVFEQWTDPWRADEIMTPSGHCLFTTSIVHFCSDL